MATSYIEKQEKQQRKIFHALCARIGMNEDDRRTMLIANYGVESSCDLNSHQLTDLIFTLEQKTNGANEMDKARKKLIAAIGGWMRALHIKDDMDKIKAIACRASGCERFNQISKERLNSLYFAFKNKQKDLNTVDALTAEMLNYLQKNN